MDSTRTEAITPCEVRPVLGPPAATPALPADVPGPEGCRRALIALPAETRRVCTVRRFVAGLLSSWGVIESDRDTAGLIVSELAGNAAQHGGVDMTVTVSLSARQLRIDVVDTGPALYPPAPRDGECAGEHGRGLGIVGYLAEWLDIQAEPDSWRSSAGLRVSGAQAPGVPQAA